MSNSAFSADELQLMRRFKVAHRAQEALKVELKPLTEEIAELKPKLALMMAQHENIILGMSSAGAHLALMLKREATLDKPAAEHLLALTNFFNGDAIEAERCVRMCKDFSDRRREELAKTNPKFVLTVLTEEKKIAEQQERLSKNMWLNSDVAVRKLQADIDKRPREAAAGAPARNVRPRRANVVVFGHGGAGAERDADEDDDLLLRPGDEE